VSKLQRIKKKKVILLILVFVFLNKLASCTPIPFYYKKTVLVETVVRVELIYYDKPEVERISDLLGNAFRRHLDLDFELVEYIETLSLVRHDELFEVLSSFTMQNAVLQNNTPSGLAILLHYESGKIDVFSSLYVGRFDNDGRFLEFLGDGLWEEPFRELIDHFFIENLDKIR